MRSKSLHSAALMLAVLGAVGSTTHPLEREVTQAPPNPKRTRSPEDVSARQRKRSEKMARRAAKAIAQESK